MKSFLILLLTISCSFISYSQQHISKTNKSFRDEFKGDEVTDKRNPSFGIFWNEKDYETYTGRYRAQLERAFSPDSGGMKVTIDLPVGGTDYFDMDFGKNSLGQKNVMDLSNEGTEGNVFIGMKMTNISDYDLTIEMALVDSNGMIKNTYNESTNGKTIWDPNEDLIFEGHIRQDLPTNTTQLFIDPRSKKPYVQFARTFNKYWSKIDSSVLCRPCHDIPKEEFIEDFYAEPNNKPFNWSAITGMRFYIWNKELSIKHDQNMHPDSTTFFNFQSEKLEQASIILHHIWMESQGSNQIDNDHDGVVNSNDICPNTPPTLSVDINGCCIDCDNDGIRNEIDVCPRTSPTALSVNSQGCEADTDNDGVKDSRDRCPNSLEGDLVDGLGCTWIPSNTNLYQPGCMEPEALNYNPYTTCPSICIYSPIFIPTSLEGCMDSVALNYNPFASRSTTCYYDLYDEGCTDNLALNYDADAIIDDGSCEYGIAGDVMGCTDQFAINYNREATVDNGSCEYYQEYKDTVSFIYGCADIDALNYSYNATFDDGSCIYVQDTVEDVIITDIEIQDTVSTDINFCEFNYDLLVDSVSVNTLSETGDSVNLELSIFQRGQATRTKSTLAKAAFEQGNGTLMYINMECGSASNNRISQTRKITFRAVYRQNLTLHTLNSQPNTVEIYPNPFKDELKFSGLQEEVVVTVFDARGTVFIEQIAIDGNSIDVSLLPHGFYTVSIQFANGSILNKGILK